ncbi:MAG: hypothetical protein R2708_23135 [Vicinamibacterales bacterium]
MPLLTRVKIFCGCPARFGVPANHDVCPVCLGLPGALPVLNGQAVDLAVAAALALGCTVHEQSVFARKNCATDLPKGYRSRDANVRWRLAASPSTLTTAPAPSLTHPHGDARASQCTKSCDSDQRT